MMSQNMISFFTNMLLASANENPMLASESTITCDGKKKCVSGINGKKNADDGISVGLHNEAARHLSKSRLPLVFAVDLDAWMQ
jgi:hypothetical protein